MVRWRSPLQLSYELDTSSGYLTERLAVSVADGPELALVRGQSSELDGATDCDLGFSPMTNAMPVLRERMHGTGAAFEIEVAWVLVPDLSVHRDHQIYEPLGDGRIRFCSPEADFERLHHPDAGRIVFDYPDIGRLQTRLVRGPLGEITLAASGYSAG